MTPRFPIALFALLAAFHCAPSAVDGPVLVLDRSACAKCGMLISDPRYAAASQTRPGEEPALFDDANCLFSFTRNAGAQHRVWFHDAAGEGWIDAQKAAFVRTPRRNGPMGPGTLAFATRDQAERYAREHQGTLPGGFATLEAEVQR